MYSWAHRYVPWLPTESTTIRTDAYISPKTQTPHTYRPATSGFLQAAQWVLAARHLPELSNVAGTLRDRLNNALHRRLARVMLGLDNSLATLRALLILTAWPSAFAAQLRDTSQSDDITNSDPSDDPLMYDPETVVSAAIRMANHMHLEQDVEKAVALAGARDQSRPYTPQESEVLDRARMVRVFVDVSAS